MSSRSAPVIVRALASASTPRASPTFRCPRCSTRHGTQPSTFRRHLTTSNPSSGVENWFTPRRTSAPSPETVHSEFLTALKSTHITALRESYDALHAQRVQSLSSGGGSETLLQPGQIMEAMTALSMRSELAALALLKRIYADLGRWDIRTGKKHYRAVLRGLCSAGKISQAMDWAEQGNGDMDDWRLVLRGAIRHEMGLVPSVEEKLRVAAKREGRTLGSEDMILLLRHLRFDQSDENETMRRFRAILAEAKENGVWVKLEGEVEMVGIHLRLRDVARAGNIVEKWNLGSDAVLWNAMLDWRIARGEGKGVELALRQMKELGLEPYGKAVGHLALREIRKSPANIMDVVDELERTHGSKVSTATWAEVLELEPDLDERLRLYEEIRARGIGIDSHIAKTLIFPLCDLNPPNLRAALDVYADLTSRSVVVSTATVRGRILAIYSTLFRAYSTLSPTADENIPINLMKDMRRFGLTLPTPALTSLIIALIRSSPDHYTAFNNYAHLYALDPALITAKSYSAIITAFISHSTHSSPFAPPGFIIEMLKDMRKAGFPASPQILTTLLTNYGAQAGRSRKSSTDPVYRQTKLDGIHKAISEIHNMLKLESLVTPDIPLYNALMDAYQRIGAYSASFEIWDLLVERRPHVLPKSSVKEVYGPSITIILDTCANAGQLARAKRIWAWAKKHHLLDADGKGKAWEGYVECLCKLGQVEEAAEVVLKEANLEMVRILSKYSWRENNLYRILPGKLRERYPEYWAVVSEDMKSRKGRRGKAEEDEEGREEVGRDKAVEL